MAFVCGTIVAPLSHYSFMLATAPAGALHGAGDHSTDSHRHDGADGLIADGLLADGPRYDKPAEAHVLCEYADLFATFSATPTANGSLVVAHAAVPLAPEARTAAPSVELILPFHLRGPPELVA